MEWVPRYRHTRAWNIAADTQNESIALNGCSYVAHVGDCVPCIMACVHFMRFCPE